jgi:hypothetical protein
MKRWIKRFLAACDPAWLEAGRSVHNRWLFGRHYRPLQTRVRQAFFGDGPVRVMTGPFSGMRYLDEVVWGSITPKWLGSYECELHGVLEEMVEIRPDWLVDVGCAEGYYAVGLPRRLPALRVLAHDCDFISRRQTRRLARLNGVETRVEVRGLCTHAGLGRLTGERVVLICDIEGAEREFLDPAACPALLGMDLLVEIHEGRWSKPTWSLLLERFAPSHEIRRVPGRDRAGWVEERCREGRWAGHEALLGEAVAENRGGLQEWFWMRSRTG